MLPNTLVVTMLEYTRCEACGNPATVRLELEGRVKYACSKCSEFTISAAKDDGISVKRVNPRNVHVNIMPLKSSMSDFTGGVDGARDSSHPTKALASKTYVSKDAWKAFDQKIEDEVVKQYKPPTLADLLKACDEYAKPIPAIGKGVLHFHVGKNDFYATREIITRGKSRGTAIIRFRYEDSGAIFEPKPEQIDVMMQIISGKIAGAWAMPVLK